MYLFVGSIILIAFFLAIGLAYSFFQVRIKFFVQGMDSGFSFSDINLLWEVAQLCNLDEPVSLYYSMNSLSKCMTMLASRAASEENVKSSKTQTLLSKLYNYRTKIQNESDDKKGISTTLALDKGQKLRIVLPGHGVFFSEIFSNGNFIIISLPTQKGMITVSAEQWVNKVVSVYLWRKADARYVFDTTVAQHGIYLGKSAIYLKHSSNLLRTQKRKAIRAKCEIYGLLFLMRKSDTDKMSIETKNGYHCLLLDISESGALIKIGGKGRQNLRIKLQFSLKNQLIMMVGLVRTVEYNQELNQSLLHFECTFIEQKMRNVVLSFVYNTLPENEKEILEALNQTDEDISKEELIASGAANATGVKNTNGITATDNTGSATKTNQTLESASQDLQKAMDNLGISQTGDKTKHDTSDLSASLDKEIKIEEMNAKESEKNRTFNDGLEELSGFNAEDAISFDEIKPIIGDFS